MTKDLPELVGPYRVQSVLGRGGWGVVYRGEGPSGDEVAVKVLQRRRDDPEHKQRFERESRIRIEHPNVVKLLDAGMDDDGEQWIAFELLRGQTLAQRLKQGPFSVTEAIRVIVSACEGVAAAHATGVVHRDLKPGNIFICEDGLVKVLDFGVARWVQRDADITMDAVVVGTPAYVSPEQARAEREIDERSDVWSLGVILYECLAGRRPFKGESALATMLAITLDDPQPINSAAPGLPLEIGPIVARALSKTPQARYPAVASLAKALSDVDVSLRSDELGQIAVTEEQDTPPDSAMSSRPSDEYRLVALLYLRGVFSARRARRAVEEAGGFYVPLWGRDGVGLFGTEGWRGDEPDRAVMAAERVQGAAARRAVTVGRIIGGGSAISGRTLDAVQENAELGADAIVIDEASARLLKDEYDVREVAEGKLAVRPAEPSRSTAPSVSTSVRPLVGRDVERASLVRVVKRLAESSSAAAVSLVGPSGIGKTRLREEVEVIFAEHLPHSAIFTARASSTKRSRAYAPLADAIRSYLVVNAERPRDRDGLGASSHILSALDDLIPVDEDREALAAGLSTLLGLSDREGGTLPPPAEASVAAERSRRTVQDFFALVAEHRPMLLALDDAQWADHESLAALEALFELLRDLPFLLVITARPQLEEERPDLFAKSGRLTRIEPQPLLSSDVAELARLILGTDLSPSALSKLNERCGGNPLFLDETLRAIRGVESAVESDALPIPVSVGAAVQARLDGLPEVERRACRVLSVVRPGLSLAELGHLGVDDVDSLVSSLARRGILARRGGATSGAMVRFRVPVVGEIAYESLGEDEREELHRAAAAVLEKRVNVDPEDLASHFERGGEPARAAHYCALAAIEAAGRGDARTAMRCADAALVLGVERGPKFRMLMLRAGAWVQLGVPSRAERDLSAAASCSASDADRAEVHAERVTVLAAAGRHDEGLREAEQAIVLADAAGDLDLVGRTLLRRASLELGSGRRAEAKRDVGEALNRLPEGAPLRAEALGIAAYLDLAAGDLWSARSKASSSADRYRAMGDLSRALRAETACADILNQLGAFEAAALALETVIEKCRLSGSELTRGFALAHSSASHLALGNLRKAERLADEIAAIANRIGDGHLTVLGHLRRASILSRQGNHPEATKAARRGAKAATEAENASLLAHALVVRAEVLLAGGVVAEALADARSAMEIRDRLGSLDAAEIALFAVLEDALRANGSAEEADRVAQRGDDRVLKMASKILDGGWRARFVAMTERRQRPSD